MKLSRILIVGAGLALFSIVKPEVSSAYYDNWCEVGCSQDWYNGSIACNWSPDPNSCVEGLESGYDSCIAGCQPTDPCQVWYDQGLACQ